MATTPKFGSTPRCGTVQLAAADTTVAKDVGNFTPAAAGTRVNKITCWSGGTAPGGTYTVLILVHDGVSAFIRDQFTLQNSTYTRQVLLPYDSLELPTGYKLQVKTLTTLTGALDFVVEGEDLT